MTPTVRAFLDTHPGVPKCIMVELYQKLEEECLEAGLYSEAAMYAGKKRDYMELAHLWHGGGSPAGAEALSRASAEADRACSDYRQREKDKAERHYDQRLVWAFVVSVVFLVLWFCWH